MPPRLLSLLLAVALLTIVFGWAASPDRDTSAQVGGLKSATATIARPKPKHKPSIGERAARIALKAVGVPYRWGGSTLAGGFDCSGLVYWAYGRLGIEVPHSSYALYALGRRVARSRMKPGDVVFFSGLGHVGLYLGHGLMVHAPHSGELVQVVSLRRSNYGSRLVGARRIASA